MMKFLSFLSLFLSSTLAVSAGSKPFGLTNPRGELFSQHPRRQSGSSQNGMPYPTPGEDPPARDTLPQSWIDAYEKVRIGSIRWVRGGRVGSCARAGWCRGSWREESLTFSLLSSQRKKIEETYRLEEGRGGGRKI